MKKLPDIAVQQNSNHSFPLEQVGMRNVEIPIFIKNEHNNNFHLTSRMDILVDLNQESKGIHMSRLYLLTHEWFQEHAFNLKNINELLTTLIESQAGISKMVRLRISFDFPKLKESLISKKSGYRYYPINLNFQLNENKLSLKLTLHLQYSSTCPCSAALSRQLIKDNFFNHFKDENNLSKEKINEWLEEETTHVATPHAQRSLATISLHLSEQPENLQIEINALIDELEAIIKTPVQTFVKREDEQEFARLNANNLIFCEDAARIFKNYLENRRNIVDYRININHLESLHAHDATVSSIKGIIGGYMLD